MVHIFSFLIPHVIYNLLSHVIQKQCLLGVLNQVTPTIANFTNPGYPQRWTVLLCSWGAVTTILSSYQTSGCRRFHQVIRVLLLFWRLCSLKIFSLSSTSYGTTIITTLRRTVSWRDQQQSLPLLQQLAAPVMCNMRGNAEGIRNRI